MVTAVGISRLGQRLQLFPSLGTCLHPQTLLYCGMCGYGWMCIWKFGIKGVQLSEARLALQLFSAVTPFHVVSHNLKNQHRLHALHRWSFQRMPWKALCLVVLRLASIPRLQEPGVRFVLPSQPQAPGLARLHNSPTIPNSQGRHDPGHYPGISACGGKMSFEASWSSGLGWPYGSLGRIPQGKTVFP